MDIFMMQYNYRSKYLVITDGDVYVYKYEKCKFDQPFLSFKPKNIFIGKPKVCEMTEFSEANDSSDFDGNTLLIEVEDNEYVYVSGLEIPKFKTDDKIIEYISLMGNNMIPYAIMIGERYTYFLYHRYKFFANDKIEEGTLLNRTDDSLDPFDYHLEKCGIDSFKKLERSLIHTFWLGHGEDDDNLVEDIEDNIQEDVNIHELEYTDGSNEIVKVFNQKCVICLERDSKYIFKQCGHQCVCEQCFQNKGDIDILKCVVCRT